jgi:hypothetical protein
MFIYEYVNNNTIPEGTVLIKQTIKQTLLDQFLQDWISSVHNSPKAFNYRIFKTDFKFEEYFNILDEQNSFLLCKFRTTNHKLPIKKGRWSNINFRGKIAIANFVKRIKLERNIITYLNVLM